MAQSATLDKVVVMLGTYVGKDKVTKLLQNAAKTVSWHYAGSNEALSSQAKSLFLAAGDARRFFRFFNQLGLIQKIISFKYTDEIALLNFLSQVASFFYLIYDNLFWLAKNGIIEGGKDTLQLYKERSMKSWFLSLLLGLAWNNILLVKGFTKEKTLKSTTSQDTKALESIRVARRTQIFANARYFGDLLTAGNGAGYSEFNDGLVGVGGMAAALEGIWACYPSK